ncbi:hypothetical protein BKA66DRAFT_413338 [Pyrenochaeta sp. MPI-SDFR-AT-0127]|nr:hypothetical protein BKA66DRAFT_413338 [Pyrenochaeta sp. MPI-SDFR-AT-0127]
MAYPQEIFKATAIESQSLLGRRRDAASTNMVSHQLQILKDTGRYDAFSLKWQPIYDKAPEIWPIADHLFWDSDIGKWIEGACYFLQGQSNPDPAIDGAVRELVEMIRTAQEPDGYLNIHYQVVEPGHRFTNLRDMHELYNLGHLIEGALAHHQYYGNDLFIAPILKYVALLHKTFGPEKGQIHGYPGHPEIELALMRLHHRTKDLRAFKLAQYFIMERGNPTGVDGRPFYTVEAEKRNERADFQPVWYPAPRSHWYQQAHALISDQQTIEGHSVRAMYLLTAVADLVRVDSATPELATAVRRLWDNMVEKKMYVTGGIGSMKQWEGFGQEYFLPQGTDEGGCYAETCASIGVMMLAQRILQYDLDHRYSDIIELCLYNAVFTAISIDCKLFTYVNQLASSEQNSSARFNWFTVCCCPPNVLRLLGMIGGYIWNVADSTSAGRVQINVHLYTSSSLNFESEAGPATLTQKSNWPLEGKVEFALSSPSSNVQLMLRIPRWATSWNVFPPLPDIQITNGYLLIPGDYLAAHSTFTIDFALKPRLITSHPLSNQRTLTVARGPIIYCVEDIDNAWVVDHFRSTYLDPRCIDQNTISEEKLVDPSLPNEEYVAISVNKAAYVVDFEELKSNAFIEKEDVNKVARKAKLIDALKFVPYYYRANRAGCGMARVGLKEWTSEIGVFSNTRVDCSRGRL